MNERMRIENCNVYACKRAKSDNDYLNVYIEIDGYRFELVPHTRTVKETALFYAVLGRNINAQ